MMNQSQYHESSPQMFFFWYLDPIESIQIIPDFPVVISRPLGLTQSKENQQSLTSSKEMLIECNIQKSESSN